MSYFVTKQKSPSAGVLPKTPLASGGLNQSLAIRLYFFTGRQLLLFEVIIDIGITIGT